MINARSVSKTLSERFGVQIEGTASDDSEGQHVQLTPSELPYTQGFSIDLLVAWRSVKVRFSPGRFAGPLVASMGMADQSQRATFGAFVEAARADGYSFQMTVDGGELNPTALHTWPSNWKSLEMSMYKGPVVVPDGDAETIHRMATSSGGRMLGAVLALLPLEPVDELPGEVEGGGKEVVVTKYERSPVNRAACIELYGTLCQICGFDFSSTYGELGDGFIEVHHIIPVSGITAGTVVDPRTDLIPVCSNCHSMLHREYPPIPPAALRAILQDMNCEY